MKSLIFLLFLLPFIGFSQSRDVLSILNEKGAPILLGLDEVRVVLRDNQNEATLLYGFKLRRIQSKSKYDDLMSRFPCAFIEATLLNGNKIAVSAKYISQINSRGTGATIVLNLPKQNYEVTQTLNQLGKALESCVGADKRSLVMSTIFNSALGLGADSHTGDFTFYNSNYAGVGIGDNNLSLTVTHNATTPCVFRSPFLHTITNLTAPTADSISFNIRFHTNLSGSDNGTIVGLTSAAATYLPVAGAYFEKGQQNDSIYYVYRKDTANVIRAYAGINTGTYNKLAIHRSQATTQNEKIDYYVNNILVGSITNPQIILPLEFAVRSARTNAASASTQPIMRYLNYYYKNK